ncbi:MAG: orange carotenoid protein N-terminal domain-containing protein [Cyanobacteria bacterium P01_F01_bin.150]
MSFTDDRTLTRPIKLFDAVSAARKAFNQLATDDRLGLLQVVYENMDGPISPAATGAARLQFAQGLLTKVKTLSQSEQLDFMRNLTDCRDTPMTRSYGILTRNTKLAFWFQLSEMMRSGTVLGVPSDHQLSQGAQEVFDMIVALEFGQRISFLRQVVTDMGYESPE